MSMELIAIISVGVMLAGISLNGQHNQRADMQALREEMNGLRGEVNGLREEVNHLRERMARLEGLLEGLREAITGRRVAVAEAVAEDTGRYDQR